MNQAKVVVFEGIDGVGKSSAIRYANRILYEHRIPHVEFHVPRSFKYGSKAVKLISDPNYPLSHASEVDIMHNVFLEASGHIRNELTVDYPKLILLDRWIPSFLVYQSKDGELSSLTKATISGSPYEKIPVDKTIILTADEATIRERLRRRAIQDGKERLDELMKRQSIYKELGNMPSMAHLNIQYLDTSDMDLNVLYNCVREYLTEYTERQAE